MMKKLTVVLFIVSCLPVYAATYYVDFDTGADANNGTSTATAFKRCPGDDSATDTALATTLTAGDTVVFKGGVVYKGRVDIDWSGSSGGRITYDGNAAGAWGTGRAVIDGEHIDTEARRRGFYAASARSYITIRNFEIRDMGGNVTPSCASPVISSGQGVYFNADASHVTVEDCYIWDIGDWENKSEMMGGIMEGVAIWFRGDCRNITISNCSITRCGRAGVYFTPLGNDTVADVEVTGCDIYENVRWGIYFGAAGNYATIHRLNIHGNTIRDVWQYAASEWLGCAGNYPHYDGIMLTENSYTNLTLGSPDNPILIHANSFYTDRETAVGGGTAEIFLTGWGGSVYMYNNVFTNVLSNGYGAIYYQGMNLDNPADFRVMNNTFYTSKYSVYVRDIGGGSPFANATALTFTNNVVYNAQTGATMPIVAYQLPIETYTEIDNNVIYTLRSGGQIALEEGNTTYTVSQLNALAFANGNVAADPLFVDISFGLGALSSSNNLSLQASSQAVGAATDLSAYFTVDKFGQERAEVWDAGAIAYTVGAGGSGPTAPNTAALTRNRNIGGTISWTDASDNETGFEIDRSFDNSTWAQIASVSANSTSYNDLTLPPSTTAYYRVRAVNGAGDSTNVAPTPTNITTEAASPVHRGHP